MPLPDLNEIAASKKVLSIKQPWLWAIFDFDKRVENRSRKLVNIPGWVWLHSPKNVDATAYRNYYGRSPNLKDGSIPLGVIMGAAKIIGCDQEMASMWDDQGCYHWRLDDTVLVLKETVPFKGGLGFPTVDNATHARLKSLLDSRSCYMRRSIDNVLQELYGDE